MQSLKPLLLGEAPSERGDMVWFEPLSLRPAEFLVRLLSLPQEGSAYQTLRRSFDTANALPRWADANPWSARRARDHVATLPKPPVVIALGARAADALGLGKLELFVSTPAPWGQAVRLPHPSGRNRQLNDPAIREQMRLTLLSFRTAPS